MCRFKGPAELLKPFGRRRQCLLWPDHASLTLAFCLATRRCMNLGPSVLVGLHALRQQQFANLRNAPGFTVGDPLGVRSRRMDFVEKSRPLIRVCLVERPGKPHSVASLSAENGSYCLVVYLADQPTLPVVKQQCYHHGCEEAICWVQKTQAVGCGEKSNHLLLYRSRTVGDREGSKAAKDQQEQLRGVRRSKRSSPDNPLIPLPL